MSAPFDFDKPKTKQTGNNWIVLGCGAAGLVLMTIFCMGGLTFYFWPQVAEQKRVLEGQQNKPPKPFKADAAKNRDYFVILKSGYVQTAMLSMRVEWHDGYNRVFNDFDAYKAELIVPDSAKSIADGEETVQVIFRQAFVKDHGIDQRDWKAKFKEQFPEKDVIYDEIKILVRRYANDTLMDCQGHLVEKHGKIAAEQPGPAALRERWNEYRIKYFREQSPKIVDKLRQQVSGLKSIKALERRYLLNDPLPISQRAIRQLGIGESLTKNK